MSTITIQALTAQSPYLAGAMHVYRDYTNFSADYTRQFFDEFLAREDFMGLVALGRDQAQVRVVGMGFGVAARPQDWWTRTVARRVGATHPALQDAWILTQLNVLRGWRSRGIGGRLHDEIIQTQPYPRLLLSTQVHNHAAQRFYQQRGWTYLHSGFAFFEGDIAYAIMRRDA